VRPPGADPGQIVTRFKLEGCVRYNAHQLFAGIFGGVGGATAACLFGGGDLRGTAEHDSILEFMIDRRS
jgi:hypothetical protein